MVLKSNFIAGIWKKKALKAKLRNRVTACQIASCYMITLWDFIWRPPAKELYNEQYNIKVLLGNFQMNNWNPDIASNANENCGSKNPEFE